MPIIFENKIEDHTKIAVWQSNEEESFFVDALELNTKELDFLHSMKPHRQREWLTSRYLVHLMTDAEARIPIDKDYCGKPSLKDRHQHISLSHSRDHVAVAYSNHCVGIDIQHKEEKINRIKDKFISTKEIEKIDPDNLIDAYHIFWGAKECMYKAYGKKELDFRKHMHLYPFKCYQNTLELKGWVRKNELAQDYDITAKKLEDYYLVFAQLT